jgi:hypothetical protein
VSRLAHATYGAPGFGPERKALDAQRALEVKNAKAIQEQTGCTWTEALKAAANRTKEIS